jgi:hypothetical protein
MGSAYFPIQFSNSPSRHCERREAIHRAARKNGLLVAALLAMTPRGHTPAISPRDAREFCTNIRLLKTEGAVLPQSGAGYPREGSRECRMLGASAAACAVVVSTRVSHHGHAGNVRHSPRNGFNGLLRALLGDRACLPPSPVKSLSPT